MGLGSSSEVGVVFEVPAAAGRSCNDRDPVHPAHPRLAHGAQYNVGEVQPRAANSRFSVPFQKFSVPLFKILIAKRWSQRKNSFLIRVEAFGPERNFPLGAENQRKSSKHAHAFAKQERKINGKFTGLWPRAIVHSMPDRRSPKLPNAFSWRRPAVDLGFARGRGPVRSPPLA